MQHFWLNKKENKKLIVFFNGWGMNETAVQHLNCDDFDVLMISDYRDLNFDFNQFNFSTYNEKYLICWSMGVYAASLFKQNFVDFNKKIAINGTTKMIDDKNGIPERIYEVTVRLLDDNSCEKFITNMFEGGKLNQNVKITKTLPELKEELIAIQKIKLKEEMTFDCAIISKKDRVVPTKNLVHYWENRAPIKEINSTHCPFEIYSNWSELLC